MLVACRAAERRVSSMSQPDKRPPRRPTPAELERALRLAESENTLGRQQRDRIAAELKALRRDLDQHTCSAAWISNCWESGDPFPPPAQTTPMVACECERCRRTGRLWPSHYAAPIRDRAGGGCKVFLSFECHLESLSNWDAARLPSSPSGLALRAIREGRIRFRRERTTSRNRRFVA
jgi:hypothetical protein